MVQPSRRDFDDLVQKDILEELDKWDSQVRQYHTSLRDPSLDYFKRSIYLLAEMIQAISKPVSGWGPRFDRNSLVPIALAYSVAGSLRSLRIAYKLLLDGYFLEGDAAMRMVKEWAEVSVLVQANPSLAKRQIEEGVRDQDRRIASRSSPEVQTLLRKMNKTFGQLSQRQHVTRIAIRLSRLLQRGEHELLVAGTASDEMLSKDGLALAGMALNVIRVLQRHFRAVPSQWQSKLKEIEKQTEQRKTLLAKKVDREG